MTNLAHTFTSFQSRLERSSPYINYLGMLHVLTLSKGHGFLSRVAMKMGTDLSHYLKNILTSLPSLGLDRVMDSCTIFRSQA